MIFLTWTPQASTQGRLLADRIVDDAKAFYSEALPQFSTAGDWKLTLGLPDTIPEPTTVGDPDATSVGGGSPLRGFLRKGAAGVAHNPICKSWQVHARSTAIICHIINIARLLSQVTTLKLLPKGFK